MCVKSPFTGMVIPSGASFAPLRDGQQCQGHF